ncbi:MAG: alternative ribosome rescue aminoacyl-tRNA hydrolase ArfB [bacterium]
MLVINRRIRIPLRELRFQFARSSGAGGQNVNKVNTKAILRWAAARSPSLPEDVRERFLARNRRRITREGELVLASQRFRDQGRNVADCLEKLRGLIAAVAAAPAKRTPTKPGRAARERRLRDKRAQSEKKKRRGRIRGEE